MPRRRRSAREATNKSLRRIIAESHPGAGAEASGGGRSAAAAAAAQFQGRRCRRNEAADTRLSDLRSSAERRVREVWTALTMRQHYAESARVGTIRDARQARHAGPHDRRRGFLLMEPAVGPRQLARSDRARHRHGRRGEAQTRPAGRRRGGALRFLRGGGPQRPAVCTRSRVQVPQAFPGGCHAPGRAARATLQPGGGCRTPPAIRVNQWSYLEHYSLCCAAAGVATPPPAPGGGALPRIQRARHRQLLLLLPPSRSSGVAPRPPPTPAALPVSALARRRRCCSQCS